MFVLDSSNSVGGERFRDQSLAFVNAMADHFDVHPGGSSRFGVVTFSTESQLHIPLGAPHLDAMVNGIHFDNGLTDVLNALNTTLFHYARTGVPRHGGTSRARVALLVVDGNFSLAQYTASDFQRMANTAYTLRHVQNVRSHSLIYPPDDGSTRPWHQRERELLFTLGANQNTQPSSLLRVEPGGSLLDLVESTAELVCAHAMETASPTQSPSISPTTSEPTAIPTRGPTAQPTLPPTTFPTAVPTRSPTQQPTASPTASPSPSPTSFPTPVQCANPADIAFVVDASLSVGDAGFNAQILAIQNTLAHFPVGQGSHQFRVGLISYASIGHLHFGLDEHTDLAGALAALRNASYAAGLTRLAAGVTVLNEMVCNQHAGHRSLVSVFFTPTPDPPAFSLTVPPGSCLAQDRHLFPGKHQVIVYEAAPTGPTESGLIQLHVLEEPLLSTLRVDGWTTNLPTTDFSRMLYDTICHRRMTRTPTPAPSPSPTANPTRFPTRGPSPSPTTSPTPSPSSSPTPSPTSSPTSSPTPSPTMLPSLSPTHRPTTSPTAGPTQVPSPSPTLSPSSSPTPSPSPSPTMDPSLGPTTDPTPSPTPSPTHIPTPVPSPGPTAFPTSFPTTNPTPSPSPRPTTFPTPLPSAIPTGSAPTCAFTGVAYAGDNSTVLPFECRTVPITIMMVYYASTGRAEQVARANDFIQRMVHLIPRYTRIRLGFVSNMLDPCQPRPARGPFRPVVSFSPVEIEHRGNVSMRISEVLSSPGRTNNDFAAVVGSLNDINGVMQTVVPGAPGLLVPIGAAPNCPPGSGPDTNPNCAVPGIEGICYQAAVARDCPVLCGLCQGTAGGGPGGGDAGDSAGSGGGQRETETACESGRQTRPFLGVACECPRHCRDCAYNLGVAGACTACTNGRALDDTTGECFDPFYCSQTVGAGPTLSCVGSRSPPRAIGISVQDPGPDDFAALSLNYRIPFYNIQVPRPGEHDTSVDEMEALLLALCVSYAEATTTRSPTPGPTGSPTATPTPSPTAAPTEVPTSAPTIRCAENCNRCNAPAPSDTCTECQDYDFLYGGRCITDRNCDAMPGYSAQRDGGGNPVSRNRIGNICHCVDDDAQFIRTALNINGYRYRTCFAAMEHCRPGGDQSHSLGLLTEAMQSFCRVTCDTCG